MLTMTQIDYIRKAFFEEGLNISQIAKTFSCDRKTVRKYLAIEDFNQPFPKAKRVTEQPKLDSFKAVIDTWLTEDLKHRRKQRHSARRVFDRLLSDVSGFNCSYRTVAAYVKLKKEQLYKPIKGALPLLHKAGEAQVDFGTADFYENGLLCTGHYLNLSFPASNAGYFQLFKGENQECLFEGLRTIFEHLGGVPPRLWFDNASTIVKKILKYGERDLTASFLRFKQHYNFTAVFCNPSSGNEKGNIENKVGYHRRNFFVPVPSFESLVAYNEELLEKAVADHQRDHYRFNNTIDELHKKDKNVLLHLPAVPYDCSRYETLKTDLYGKFKYGSTFHTYSTAPKYAASRILVQFTASAVIPLDESMRPITKHKRLYGDFKQEQMDWIPYLTQLSRCPSALKYSGIYEMLPNPVQDYLEKVDKPGQRNVLKVLAKLSQENGFARAVDSIAEAIRRDRTDLDSLLTLHKYLKPVHMPETMDVSQLALPELPTFSFEASQYDTMLLSPKAVAKC
ncbi:Transposase [Propionispira arboris]|uniref:Transposase n=7 Tax=Propionispira arboris TaxID=84035 RepID=A0A1H7DEV8_9FIRM|nr:IS21 family transposase [Propionispira arboris]SEJ98092.1 Transposase [Propionispira arboris]